MRDTLQTLFKRSHADRRISLHVSLGLLVATCIIPAVVLSAFLLYGNSELKRDAVFRSTELIAREVISDLDRELSGIESGLRLLATSQALAKGDLQQFHSEARSALPSQVVYNYILTDREGRQVLNTLRPYGTPLPTSGTPVELKAVFEEKKTVLTNMFLGPVTQKLGLAMGVPVIGSDQEVQYSLNIGLDPAYLEKILQKRDLPPEWLIAILDQSGTIVARSREAERYVGQKAVDTVLQATRTRDAGTMDSHSKEGIPVVTAFVRSKFWGWTAVTGAPRSQLTTEVQQTTWLSMALLVAGFTLGSAVAFALARQVLSSVRDLNAAALALQSGKPIDLPRVQLKEAQAVGAAIVQASLLMEEARHRATHDPLTRLGNRELFFAMGHHHVAEAQRSGRPLALLAMDLDHFKEVNDSEGHPKGDLVLKAVASRISAVIRASDIAARTGGDEFTVLLVDADKTTAASIAARIVDEIARPVEGVATPVGASIGIAVYPAAGGELQSLVESADKALYNVKRNGRNGYQFA